MTMTPSQLLEAAMDGTLDLDGTGVDAPAADQGQPAAPAADQAPAENTDEQQAEQGEQKQGADEQPAPIASRNGEYTIPYDKLLQARQEAAAAKAEAAQLREQMVQLSTAQQQNLAQAQADAQARADAGQAATEADANLSAAAQAMANGVDQSVFGDFSEEAIAAGIAKLVDAATAPYRQAIEQQKAAQQQQAEATAAQTHYQTILSKHADASDIVESQEWTNWLGSLPSFARTAVEQAMQAGSAQQVIEVFDTFKQAQGAPAGLTQGAPLAAPIKTRPPASLTDVPGGLNTHSTSEQVTAAAAQGGASLMALMEGKTPEEINRLMDNAL